MRIPLSVARGARLPGEAWTRRDWLLAQAVEMLDATRCRGCGQPTWLSHDRDLKRRWKVSAERCFSCDAQASRQKELSGDNVHNPSAIHFRTTLLDGY